MVVVPQSISDFLHVETPDAWIDEARERVPELLLDHANCELKAASTALGFLYRYPGSSLRWRNACRDWLARNSGTSSRCVRSWQNMDIVSFERVSASRYAGASCAMRCVRQDEPQKLMDLYCWSVRVIEARSCERFARIAPQTAAQSWANSTLDCWPPRRVTLNTTSRSRSIESTGASDSCRSMRDSGAASRLLKPG